MSFVMYFFWHDLSWKSREFINYSRYWFFDFLSKIFDKKWSFSVPSKIKILYYSSIKKTITLQKNIPFLLTSSGNFQKLQITDMEIEEENKTKPTLEVKLSNNKEQLTIFLHPSKETNRYISVDLLAITKELPSLADRCFNSLKISVKSESILSDVLQPSLVLNYQEHSVAWKTKMCE